MSISKFALTGLRAALALALAPIYFAPISLAWAQAAGAPTGAGAAQGQAPVVYRCPGPPVLYTDTLSPQEARSKNCKPLTDLPVAVAPPAPKPMPVQPAAQPPVQAAAPGSAAAGSGLGATGSTSPVGTATATAGSAALPAGAGTGFVTPPPGGSRIGAAGAAQPPGAGAAATVAPSASGGAVAAGSGAAAGTVAAVAMPDTRIRPDDQRSRDAEARRILEAELRREEARLNDAIKASGTAKPGERVGADAAQIRRAESDIEAIRRELGRLR